MKPKFHILILMTLFLGSFVAGAQINLNSGLVGHFTLDGNPIDSSPTAINGVVSNATLTAGKTNNIDSAYFFNGVNANIDCSTDNRGISDTITISAWVKTTFSGFQFVVGKYDWTVDKGYQLSINNGHPVLAGRNLGGQYVTTNLPNPIILVDDGNWHFLLAEISGNTWSLWVDCVLENTVTSSSASPDLTNSEPLTIGNYFAGTGGNNLFFDGSIDEVRLYNRTLNPAEVQLICDINYVDPILNAPQVSNDTVVCIGSTVTLNAIPDSGTIYWESPQGTIINTGNSHTALIAQNTIFYVYSVLNGIMSDTAVINVGVKTCATYYPGYSVADTALCEDEVLLLIIHPDSGVVRWDSPVGTSIAIGDTFNIVVTQTQQYFLYVEYATGNSDTSSFTVTMKNCSSSIYPPIAPKDTVVCENTDVTFKALRDTGEVFWLNEKWEILDTGVTVTLNFDVTSLVYLYNKVGQHTSDTMAFVIRVEDCGEAFFPNIFTPNGDGVNDYLFFDIPNATCFNARIYNRWGVLVYEMNEIEFAWDGFAQSTGKSWPDGVYYYVVTYCVGDADEQEKRGSITLIR